MGTLKHSDVAWYMVMHYVIPLGVAGYEWQMHGRDAPTPWTFAGVAFCLVWALGVMAYRTGGLLPDKVAGGLWGFTWLLVMTGYLPFLKRTCTHHKATGLERVFYSNFLALVILILVAAIDLTSNGGGAPLIMADERWTLEAYAYVGGSCVTGTALSYVKMELMTHHISATAYASFGSTALFPVRVWQSFSRVS